MEWFLFRKLASPSIMLTKSSLEVKPMSNRNAVPELPAWRTLGDRSNPSIPTPVISMPFSMV